MAELLLEILSEEIPARMQARAAEDLRRLVTDGLAAGGLAFDHAQALVTPRRLVLAVSGLPLAQADLSEERRGPRVGAPAQAMDGFLKSTGLTLEQLERRDTGKGEFWFAVLARQGRPAVPVIQEVIEAAMAAFPWPKSMHWGTESVRWVRPVQSLLCLFDGAAIPVRFGSVVAGATTLGHRFLAPQPVAVRDFADYRAKLAAAKVMLDPHERRAAILAQAEAAAAALGCALRPDDGLLDEVTGLVEWPVVLTGRIDAAFMAVPPEVLVTSMRAHQKYFSLQTPEGGLAPHFLVVSNMEAADGGAAVLAGNQRVLRARLSDAAFFWENDRKIPLAERVPRLDGRLFYARLGSMGAKVERIKTLARHLTFSVEGAKVAEAERAAVLAKADLTTEMVGEFPELQGVMGYYYAIWDGEAEDVAQAIADHYFPQGPSDPVPTHPLGIAVALADRIDTLVGFFAIDEKPTGNKDPFGLRRAALGVIRLVVENRLRLPLAAFFKLAHAQFAGGLDLDADATCAALLAFFADRLKGHLKEQGVRHDLVNAVFALGDEDDLVRLLARVAALSDFLATDDGANLLVAYRRAANIVRIEERKDGVSHAGGVAEELLRVAEERDLFQALAAFKAEVARALKAERFAEAMAALARLRRPVDAFFAAVTVNADDSSLRANRLRLLSEIGATTGAIADFSRIEG